jgi:hypothetical protein
MQQLTKDSLVDKFLGRYQRPEDLISFEIRALAMVEMEQELERLKKDCQRLGANISQLERLISPVIEFLAHPEINITRFRLVYLMGLLEEYKLVLQTQTGRRLGD